MKKINFRSIKSRLILAFSGLALLLIIVIGITLSQVGNVVVIGVKLLDNRQPSRMHIEALRSEVRNTNVLLQSYLLSGDATYSEAIEDNWEEKILPITDTIRSLKENWNNPENIILLEKTTRLAERIRSTQKEIIESASFESGTATIDITSFPGFRSDSIMDPFALQSWIAEEISNQQSLAPDNSLLFISGLVPLITEFDQTTQNLYENLRDETKALGKDAFAAIDKFIVIEIIVLVLYLIICVLLLRFILRKILRSINKVNNEVKILSEGNIPEEKKDTDDELGIVLTELYSLSSNLKNVKSFALEVGKGHFDHDISVFNNEGEIGRSLAEMRDSLKKVSEEAVIRNWSNKGFAELGDILRKHSDDLAQLSDHVITYMVNYLKANQGSLFIIDDNEGDQRLKLAATYAYDRKKFIDKIIEPGQGLVGQVFIEKESIYLKEIPDNYVTITSGLGKATPKSLYIMPLIANEKVFGVIELGSFSEFKPHERDFIDNIGENIASSIQAVKINEQTRTLLDESQQMTEQMRSQEEEMRQNMEELQATQEEMERTQLENNERIHAIENSGLASVEMKPNGEFLQADTAFLKLFKFSGQEQLKGLSHAILMPANTAGSSEYKEFWDGLNAGKSFSGIYNRKTSTGDAIWINATYTPLRSNSGQVSKILMFAQDVTSLKKETLSAHSQKEALLATISELQAQIALSEEKAKEIGGSNKEKLQAYQQELNQALKAKLSENEEALKKALARQKKDLDI